MQHLYRFPGLEHRSPEFRRAFVAMCAELGIDPNFIGAVITTESGWDPHQPNLYHSEVLKRPIDKCAYGLIQFLPSLLANYGTSASELERHDAIWQLQFVRRFYAVHARKIRSAGQAYMATFLPAYMAMPSDFVLGVSNDVVVQVDRNGCLTLSGDGVGVTGGDQLGYGLRLGAVYEQNSGFDANRDGVITVGEVTATAERTYERARAAGVWDDSVPDMTPPKIAEQAKADTDPAPPMTVPAPTVEAALGLAEIAADVVGGAIETTAKRVASAVTWEDLDGPVERAPNATDPWMLLDVEENDK